MVVNKSDANLIAITFRAKDISLATLYLYNVLNELVFVSKSYSGHSQSVAKG